MWILRIYSRLDFCLDIRSFESMQDLCKFLKQQDILLLDCSLCIDFREV